MLQDFAVGLWFRRLQKRVRKIRFFPYCIQDSPISSFHLQKSRLYALIFWFYPLLCKGHLSIFDLCWGDFTTLPSYCIGHLFQIFNPPGVRRGEKTFSTPYRNCCPLSSAGSLVTITGGTLFHRARKQAIKAPPPQSPTRFHISHLIGPNNWTCPPVIILSDPRFHGSPAILFHKVKKASGGVPHDRKAKDQVHSNVRPGPLPSRNSQEKSCIKSR